MAISKGLAEAHGGRIWARSEGPGLGTRFTFTVPAAEQPAETPEKAAAEPPRALPGPVRVLVVDNDSPITPRHVRGALAEAGYDLVLTGDPGEVAGLMQTSWPDLVLLDLVLPGADGIELMSRIPALLDIPVIFLSGYGRNEPVARSLQAGANDYVVQPFSPTELVATPYRLGSWRSPTWHVG